MLIVYLQDRCRLRASLAFSGESNLRSLNLAQKFLCDRVEPQRGDSWVLWLLVPARPALLDDVLTQEVRIGKPHALDTGVSTQLVSAF